MIPFVCRANCLLFLAFSLVVLAGCTTLPQPREGPSDFVLRGKLAVTQAGENFSARVLWQQHAAHFALDVWGPLGQGRMRLEGTPEHLTLVDGQGAVVTEGPAEAVMIRHLGWSLPLEVLPEWVRGRPAPGLPVARRERDDEGRLVAFEQLRWRVELERYAPVAGAQAAGLPHRVTATRGSHRLRLAVSEWRI